MTETMIYWITRLDEICKFCDVVQTIALVFTVIGMCILLATSILKHTSESEEDVKIANGVCKMSCKIWIPALCVALICSFARIFTPTSREMVAIKVIPQIANVNNVEKVKDLSKDMVDVATKWLNDMQNKFDTKQVKRQR